MYFFTKKKFRTPTAQTIFPIFRGNEGIFGKN